MSNPPKLPIVPSDIIGIITHANLEACVCLVYGLSRWSVTADADWDNSALPNIVTVSKITLHESDKKKLEELKHRGVKFVLPLILTDLCNRNLLAPGRYVFSSRSPNAS